MGFSLSFLGATGSVTGSRYLLECNGSRILVDCGLYQERALRDRNWQAFPLPPGSIDKVIITHAHIDHSGFLPRLVREGFRGAVYCTQATAEIADITLLDAAHIQSEDAQFKINRHRKEGRQGPYPVLPLYTRDDAVEASRLFIPRGYGKPLEIGEGIEMSFHDAGHILGSAMIKLKVKQNGVERSIVFSGDIGRWNKPILRDPTVFDQADYVVMESTYGDRSHEDPRTIDALLEDAIWFSYRRGGNIVIPSFAVERAQELLYCLNKLLLEKRIPHLAVYIDSPMAVRVTEVFKRHRELYDDELSRIVSEGHSPFVFPGLKMVSSIEESKAINQIKAKAVIVAGSGMCTGGRIKHHLVHNISRRECTVLFVGFQAVGTLGHSIVTGATEVRILGQVYPVNARKVEIHGLSAHADRAELLKWASGLKQPPRAVFVTHGEPEVSLRFAETLRESLGWQTSVPGYLDKYTLD